MEVIRFNGSLPSSLKGGAITIGKFDGVHCAHALILKRLTETARKRGIPAVVFTFDNLPSSIIQPKSVPPLLCTLDRRLELINEFSPSAVVLLPATKEFFSLEAHEFFDRLIVREFQSKYLVEGENFNFGRNKEGDVDLLGEFCRNNDLALEIIPAVRKEIGSMKLPVSSSLIRSLLLDGDITGARELLTRPYRLTGPVIQGDHRGRTLGYPTANLGQVETLIPGPGLYSGFAVFDGEKHPAAINLGGNPTFGIEKVKIEVHILDFKGNIYDKTIHVDFMDRLRKIIHFESKEALLKQMEEDMKTIRARLVPLSDPVKKTERDKNKCLNTH